MLATVPQFTYPQYTIFRPSRNFQFTDPPIFFSFPRTPLFSCPSSSSWHRPSQQLLFSKSSISYFVMILLWVLCRTQNLNEFNLQSAPCLNLDYWVIVEKKKKSLWIGNSSNSWSPILTQPLMTLRSPIMCLWAVFIFCEATVLNCLLCSKRQDPHFSLHLHMTLPPRRKIEDISQNSLNFLP